MAQYDFITSSGVIVADTSATKNEVEAESRAIFGDDVDLSDESPNGVLVNAEVISRNGIAVNNAKLANQINPRRAGGVFLDAIMGLSTAITGGRLEATKSTFSTPVDITGVPNTVIPSGSIASTSSGDEFETLSNVTLDGFGNGSVQFQSVMDGAIPAGIGELNSIVSGPVGWETVNNTVAATLGRTEESDPALRLRRIDTLASQGTATSIAIQSAIAGLDGFRSQSFRENVTDAPQVIDGVNLSPHSTFSCVDGATDDDIANAILFNRLGSNFNGSTSVPVTDPSSGQIYNVLFQRPAEIQIYIRATIAPTTVTDPVSVVKQSILDYANGKIDGERGFVVGSDVSPFEISGAVNINTPEITVNLVELSLDGNTYNIAVLPINIDQVARTTESQIEVIIS